MDLLKNTLLYAGLSVDEIDALVPVIRNFAKK